MSHRNSPGTQTKCYAVRWFGITFSCLGCKCKFTQTLKRILCDFQFVSSVWIDYRCKLNCFLRIHLKKGLGCGCVFKLYAARHMVSRLISFTEKLTQVANKANDCPTAFVPFHFVTNTVIVSFCWCGAMRRGTLCNCFFLSFICRRWQQRKQRNPIELYAWIIYADEFE